MVKDSFKTHRVCVFSWWHLGELCCWFLVEVTDEAVLVPRKCVTNFWGLGSWSLVRTLMIL